MNGDTPAATGRAQRVFISYSGADRGRVSGLGLLLEALGHEVFLDHKTIKPGERWEAKLQEGLDRADVLLVFWTKHAARSDWVRKELEHFHVDFPQRLLVPVLGDETPLSELLKPYQQSDFCPLINELLALKRNMQQQNVKPAQIQQAILDRLREAGIEVPSKDRKKLFGLFSSTGLVGLFTTPLLFLQQLATSGLEAAAQLSGAQTVLVGAAAVSGGVLCAVAGQLGGSGSVEIGTLEYPKTIISDNPASNLTVRYSGNPAFPLEIVFQARSCPSGASCETYKATVDQPNAERRFRGEGWVWCAGVQDRWDMDWEVVLRDSAGHEVSHATPIQCLPRPAPGGFRRN